MRATTTILLGLGWLLISSACEQERRVGDDGDAGGGADAVAPQYMSFASVTRAIDYDDLASGLVVAATDLSGVLGCALSDETARPGRKANLVFAKFDTQHSRCPEGTYAINSDSSYCGDKLWGESLRAGCAGYRRWNDAGNEEASILATAGAAQISLTRLAENQERCTITMELVFPGATWSETFSVEYDPFTAGLPLCVETNCGASCQPWQRCNSSGQCEDVSCIDRGNACPTSGSPACCTYNDVWREFSCQESQSNPETTLCCVGVGSSCRYNDDCCWPYSCLEDTLGTFTCS